MTGGKRDSAFQDWFLGGRTSNTRVEIGKFVREPPIPDCGLLFDLGIRDLALNGFKTCRACVAMIGA